MRFVFDNNLPHKVAKAIATVESQVSVQHLRDHYPEIERNESVPDVRWLSELGGDADMCVITEDRRILNRSEERRAFKASKLRLVILAPAIQSFSLWHKFAWLVAHWPAIRDHAAALPIGSAVSVRLNGKKFDRLL